MSQKNDRSAGESTRRRSVFSFDHFYRINRRVFIWLILAFLLWLLRSFFSLIFLTFVFAFVASPIARFLQEKLQLGRRLAICFTFGAFVALIALISVFIVPQVAKEAISLVGNLRETEHRLLELRRDLFVKYPAAGPIVMNYLRSTIPDEMLEEMKVDDVLSEHEEIGGHPLHPERATSQLPESKDVSAHSTNEALEQELERSARDDEAVIHLALRYQIKKITEELPRIIRLMWSTSATVLLALLFSFLISLDIARLGQEVRNLSVSRLRDFHNEVAQPVVRFAYVVGRAIQAQAMIASVNTLLTLIGLALLGVPSLAVLSMIVFLCSFIPVLGVFLSTAPILLVALNSSGIHLAMLCVVMVIAIHAVEAYLLNPIIYGKHLKLNPVLVLIILFIGHHAFGVWGMLLGVPVAHYIIHDVFGVPIWSEKILAGKPGKEEGAHSVEV